MVVKCKLPNILVDLLQFHLAWRELHMLEISVDEFLDKASALKGNIDLIIARQRDAGGNDEADEDELQETPVVRPLGNFFFPNRFTL